MTTQDTLYVHADGTLRFRGVQYRCALGKNGIATDKREGDLKTPAGNFPLRGCFYRPDHAARPTTGLPITPITTHMGWCDDPQHPEYNRLVFEPFAASHEKLWRDDPCYDLLVVIGYNTDPIAPGKGSAIFLHLAKEGYAPTEGCIAVFKEDMLRLLPQLGPISRIEINQ